MFIELKKYTDIDFDTEYANEKFIGLNSFFEKYIDYTGWYKNEIIDIDKIKEYGEEIKSSSDYLIIVGIGGSLLGTRAIINSLKSLYDEKNVIFSGDSIDQDNIIRLKKIIQNHDVTINFISKSGTTLEPNLTFNELYKSMREKYEDRDLYNRIIYTTSKKEVVPKGYRYLIIPNDIGGRFSCFTAASLLPLYVSNIDIDEFIMGSLVTEKMMENAKKYAVAKKLLNRKEKSLELLVTYNKKYQNLLEWMQQLFAESLGKEGKGIFPIVSVNTKDLHSIGQFIQEGKKNLFETVLFFKEENIIYNNEYDCFLPEINELVAKSVVKAHYDGNVPNIIMDCGKIDPFNLGYFMKLMMLSTAILGFLENVNPFDQEGVENYKKEVNKNLDRIKRNV